MSEEIELLISPKNLEAMRATFIRGWLGKDNYLSLTMETDRLKRLNRYRKRVGQTVIKKPKDI